jgi:hypothetical protein
MGAIYVSVQFWNFQFRKIRHIRMSDFNTFDNFQSLKFMGQENVMFYNYKTILKAKFNARITWLGTRCAGCQSKQLASETSFIIIIIIINFDVRPNRCRCSLNTTTGRVHTSAQQTPETLCRPVHNIACIWKWIAFSQSYVRVPKQPPPHTFTESRHFTVASVRTCQVFAEMEAQRLIRN